MKLFAKRPCNFSGQNFFIGDEIPAEFVLNPEAQEKMGVLVIGTGAPETADLPKEEPSTIAIMIPAGEGDVRLDISPAAIQDVFRVLIGNATNAEEIIAQMTEGQALLLLNLSDNRKTIKAAAEARAKELNPEEGEA